MRIHWPFYILSLSQMVCATLYIAEPSTNTQIDELLYPLLNTEINAYCYGCFYSAHSKSSGSI